QDGCDQFCSYCVVPFARPDMYSRPYGQVLEEARELASRGFKEIVLTGIRLGRYEDKHAELVGLLEDLAGVPGIERIRLSSIELTDVHEGLLGLMARSRKICRHLHVPLESGDDGVLARMNRPYTTAEFSSFVREARAKVPGIAITTDIMVGFPGETDDEFETSYAFAEEMQFARMHVFKYSVRPQTAAAMLPDDVSHAQKERRSARLIELSRRCCQEFASAFLGAAVSVLVEGKRANGNVRSGLTDNYLKVAFEGGCDLVGKIVNVRIEWASQGVAFGVLAERNGRSAAGGSA
ncbi:MAG TPA: MiaB/RimO family radical SAM methylthiotransferase, partial [Armatimonadota bacterium]|nr:MiaB/RimO family radical SAM methylthiotransferase [Armatimonadota bacterium]